MVSWCATDADNGAGGIVIRLLRTAMLTRRGRLMTCLPICLMLGACVRPVPERIVLIVIDTLRRDALSCYGGSTPTPNIDGLAAQGQLFSNALGSFHQTTMSMGAMFTGRTPSLESGKGNSRLVSCPGSSHAKPFD